MNAEFLTFPQTIVVKSRETLNEMAALLPKFFLALFVFLVGWLIGMIIEWLFIKAGEKLKLSKIWKMTGLENLMKKTGIKSTPSRLAGTFIKSIIIMFFARESMQIMEFTEIEEFIGQIIALTPDIIIALFILLVTIRAADMVGTLVENFVGIGDTKARKIMAVVAKNILITFGIMAVLVQMHIAEELVQTLFTALVAMLALAGGLAFGLGGKDFVHDMIEDFRKKKS